ncbi:DUF4252 domain-containing protein [Flavobacteriaceae bacterium]|jgi:hypothetical protein|nr:DUF4252 domain-containing protein [Flavobacteriaceae bacterium]
MKKLLSTLLLAMFVFNVHAQSFFDEYENRDDVSFFSISPKMFQMLGKMSINVEDPEASEFLKMVMSINNFKVLISGSDQVSTDMLQWVDKQVVANNLETLITIKDPEADVVFYVKEGKSADRVEKLLMYSKDRSKIDPSKNLSVGGRDIESVLMLLEGDIDLNQISKLTEKMDLPGGRQLQKAGKKKQL